MVLSDRTIQRLLDEGRIEIDPYDPALLQPSSVDVRVDRFFRVFHNARYPYIDVKEPQEELTELVEIDEERPFILHPGEFVLASTLERIRLPDDLALAVRTYLTRGGDLAPGSRDAMGERLAQAVASYVSPAPPNGTPAWAYLAALLAERRRRSEASLHAYLTATPVRPSPLLCDATAPRVTPRSTQRHPPSNLSTQGAPVSNGEVTQGHIASESGGFAAPL